MVCGRCVKPVNVWFEIWKHTCQRRCVWHTWNSRDATNNNINRYMWDDEETRISLGNTHEQQTKISRALLSTRQLLQLIVFPPYFCVYILLHHVAYTANSHKTSRVYLLNLIYIAVISFFYGKLSKESLYAGLLTADCPETQFSGLLFHHCQKSFGKTFKTFFCCCLEVAKVLESENLTTG